jgi:hypothetical protein
VGYGVKVKEGKLEPGSHRRGGAVEAVAMNVPSAAQPENAGNVQHPFHRHNQTPVRPNAYR